ncbi:MAG: hypothetical protein IPH07_16530 [Deltaproteobacteria bacterium]|nr:hypothetical protein [Deltaproteobacteria bacterium]MBP7287642.1 hypothetical protein [Nannocystaceae bacterium]
MRTPAGLAAFVIVAALACDADEPDDAASGADALLRALQDADYAAWDSTEVPAPSFHGAQVRVFADPTLAQAQAGAAISRWPTGATAIAEVRGADASELSALLVARRDRDAWLWAAYDREQSATSYGTAVACVHCHAAGDDFLRSFTLPE